MPEGLFAKLGGGSAALAVLLVIGGWTYDIKRDSEQVTTLKSEVKTLKEFSERTDKRLCLILVELAKTNPPLAKVVPECYR